MLCFLFDYNHTPSNGRREEKLMLWSDGRADHLLCAARGAALSPRLGAPLLELEGRKCEDDLMVEGHVIGMLYGVLEQLSPEVRTRIGEGYLFYDWFAIPQITARQPGVNEETTKSDAALAVQSIPAYVEACNLFFVLCPELHHQETGERCNYTSWLQRGWCRAELYCRLLSIRADTSVIVVYSSAEAEFMFYLDWQQNNISDGTFTVEADRSVVVRLGEVAVESKLKHVRGSGPLDYYRFFSATEQKVLGRSDPCWTQEQFLEHFQFSSLAVAAQDRVGMNGVMCAAFAGDGRMLRCLVEQEGDVNCKLHGLERLGFWNTLTPLMIAARMNHRPDVLRAMLELRANVNDRVARSGINAAFMVRSPGQVEVLLAAKADFHSAAAVGVGLHPLTGVASFATAETLTAMLWARCDPNPDLQGVGWSPLHALALMSRGNPYAKEKAHLLLAHRADPNARARPTGMFAAVARLARVQASLWGLRNCLTKTRYAASVAGITPLGMAALVGDEQLACLFLEIGAELSANDRGDLPDDLARANRHHHLVSVLSLLPV
ncbi:unnamed protein product [Symbiodinium sp. CCMP2592]|nr:unnamed protein product [Symbiodinium sp. CCMP2592]